MQKYSILFGLVWFGLVWFGLVWFKHTNTHDRKLLYIITNKNQLKILDFFYLSCTL